MSVLCKHGIWPRNQGEHTQRDANAIGSRRSVVASRGEGRWGRLGALCVSLLVAGCGARSALFESEAESEGEPPCKSVPAPVAPASQRFGDSRQQIATSIAIDSAGYPVIAGAFTGTLDLGVATMTAPVPDENDLGDQPLFGAAPLFLWGSFFVARPLSGDCSSFAAAFTPMKHYATGIEVAVGAAGAITLAASYSGAVDFGGGPLGGADHEHGGAIVRLGPDGTHLWSREVVAPDALLLARPAFDAQGNVFAAGLFSGALSVDGALVSDASPGVDAFVAKFSESGVLLWTKVLRLRSAWKYTSLSVAAWPSGEVAVSGAFENDSSPIDLGDGPFKPLHHQSGFVTSLDPAGQHRWHELVLDSLMVDSRVDTTGSLLVIGGSDGLGFPIRRYDIQGVETGKIHVDGADIPLAWMDVAPGGDILLAGSGGLNPTPGTGLSPPEDWMVQAFRLAPSGEVMWKRTFPCPEQAIARPAFGPSGTPYLAGAMSTQVDFGTGLLQAQGQTDVFFATLPP